MKRIQLYIDEADFKTLQEISHEQMVSISELLRKAVTTVYIKEKPDDAGAILARAAGIWKDRKDISSADEYVCEMRRDAHVNF